MAKTETKEMKQLRKAIYKWIRRHGNNVQFIGSFMAFKGKNYEVIDDLIIGYGPKETIKLDLKELTKGIKEEKEEFINW